MSVAGVSYSPVPMEFHGQDLRQYNTAVQPERKIKTQHIESATRNLQKIGNAFNKKLQFMVDNQSNQIIVKVIDKETDKVIKELPPEELQMLYRNLKEAIGLLFDEMV